MPLPAAAGRVPSEIPAAPVVATAEAEPAPPAEPTPAAAPPAEPAAGPVSLPFDTTGFFSAQGSAPPQAVAQATHDLADYVLKDDSYVGPSAHTVLYRDLQMLEDVSNAVSNDTGADPAVSARLRAAYGAALDEAIDRTDIIFQRPGESQETVEKSQQLLTLLNVAKTRGSQ
jgi:hypothetical protein